jgi:hypothetical protein
MGTTMIVASRASWQRILIKILSQISETIHSSSSQHTNPFNSSRGHFRVAVKGTFCFCLNTNKNDCENYLLAIAI